MVLSILSVYPAAIKLNLTISVYLFDIFSLYVCVIITCQLSRLGFKQRVVALFFLIALYFLKYLNDNIDIFREKLFLENH